MIALIKNGISIIHVTDGDTIPGGIYDNGGWWFSGFASAGESSPDGVYSVIPATLDADQPGKVGTIDLNASTVVNGIAQIVRTWAAVVPSVPEKVKVWQCQVWLIQRELKSQVDALIAAQNNAELTFRWGNGFLDLYRSEPLLDTAAAQFGKGPADVDAAFIEMSQV